jgi:hypothetical protein
MKRILIYAAALAVALPASAAVKFQSNSVKYRDAGKKPAIGRSGSATIQARALVNKDHTADLQLTTGSFDPVSSRGNIDKVQIKSQSTGTINDNRLRNNGTYSVNLRAVDRGQTLDVMAHVSGIDGRRTDIVSVRETARFRPDLQVATITLPAAVLVGAPVVIDATIRELNGDTGARANCELRVNGTTVDRASGIWVDAAGTVSCSFRHTFPTVGLTRVEVAVVDVNPGDYDSANNILRKDVEVRDDGFLSMPRWSASAEEVEQTYDYVNEASWGYHFDFVQSGWTNQTWFSASWNDNLDLNTMKASYVEKTDGKTVLEYRNIPLQRDDSVYPGRGGAQCMVGLTELVTVEICQRAATPGRPPYEPARPAFINPQFTRRSGDVTYISHEWGKPTPDAPDGSYVKNENTHTVYGVPIRLGSSVSLEIEVSDATRRFRERPSFAMQTEVRNDETPWRCWNEYWCGAASIRGTLEWGRALSPGY